MKDVINEGLGIYNDEKIELLSAFTSEFSKRKRISYYEFMNFIYQHRLSDQMNLMVDLVSLYSFKNRPIIYESKFQKVAQETSRLILQKQMQVQQKEDHLQFAKEIQRFARTQRENSDYDQDDLNDEIYRRIRTNTMKRQQILEDKRDLYLKEGRDVSGVNLNYDQFNNVLRQTMDRDSFMNSGMLKINADQYNQDYIHSQKTNQNQLKSSSPQQQKLLDVNSNIFSKQVETEILMSNNPNDDNFENIENDKSIHSQQNQFQQQFSDSKSQNSQKFQQNQNKSLNRRIKDTLQQELKNNIDQYIEYNYSNNKNNNDDFTKGNMDALKQTFFELFFAKLVKILSMIYIKKQDKFFQLVRKSNFTQDEALYFKRLCDTYQYYKRNKDNINQQDIVSYVIMLINFDLIKEEMKFFMDYHMGNNNNNYKDIERLLNLEDSMFYSDKSKKSLDNRNKNTGFDSNTNIELSFA